MQLLINFPMMTTMVTMPKIPRSPGQMIKNRKKHQRKIVMFARRLERKKTYSKEATRKTMRKTTRKTRRKGKEAMEINLLVLRCVSCFSLHYWLRNH